MRKLRNFYFTHLRSDGCIRIPAGIIDGMNLPKRCGFAIEPDKTTGFLYLEIIRPKAEPETGQDRASGRGTRP